MANEISGQPHAPVSTFLRRFLGLPSLDLTPDERRQLRILTEEEMLQVGTHSYQQPQRENP